MVAKYFSYSLGLLSFVLALIAGPVGAAPTIEPASKTTVEILSASDVVPEVVALGLKPIVRKISIKKLRRLHEPEDQYLLQIEIGKVTHDQFLKLKGFYGNQSQVVFDAGREYELTDFFPPVMQALVNKSFFPRFYDTSKINDYPIVGGDEMDGLYAIRKNGLSFFTNCWNTTMEVLKLLNPARNGKQTFTVRWPGRWEADDLLKDPKYSHVIKEGEARFGDVLLVSSKQMDAADDPGMLQHTALVVNEKLFFEKTDGSKDDPFRLSLRDDVVHKYDGIFDDSLILSYRRYGENHQPLPEDFPKENFPEELKKILREVNPQIPLDRLTFGCDIRFGGGCDPIQTEFDEVEIKIDEKTGRGIITGKPELVRRFVSLSGREGFTCKARLGD